MSITKCPDKINSRTRLKKLTFTFVETSVSWHNGGTIRGEFHQKKDKKMKVKKKEKGTTCDFCFSCPKIIYRWCQMTSQYFLPLGQLGLEKCQIYQWYTKNKISFGLLDPKSYLLSLSYEAYNPNFWSTEKKKTDLEFSHKYLKCTELNCRFWI